MRQVGVQLQDYGTRLCWQACVDDPGDDLGVPIFVHAAPPPDMQSIKVPEAPPAPVPLVRGDALVLKGGWDHGNDTQWNFVPLGEVSIVPPPGYVYDHAELAVQQGPAWYYRAWPATPSDTTIQIGLGPVTTAGPDMIQTVGNPVDETDEPSVVQVLAGVYTAPGGLTDDTKYDITLQVTPVFKVSKAAVKATNDQYAAAMNTYNEQTKQAYQASLYQSIFRADRPPIEVIVAFVDENRDRVRSRVHLQAAAGGSEQLLRREEARRSRRRRGPCGTR